MLYSASSTTVNIYFSYSFSGAAGSPQLAWSVADAMTHIINSERGPSSSSEKEKKGETEVEEKRACLFPSPKRPTAAKERRRSRRERRFTVGDHANLPLYTQRDGTGRRECGVARRDPSIVSGPLCIFHHHLFPNCSSASFS